MLSNGDIITVGIVSGQTEESPNYQNSWIMRLDSMGCLIPGCHITSVEPEKEPEDIIWQEEEKSQLLIYPNPATNVVYLMLQNYEEAEYILQITDMNGRIVQSQTPIFSDTQYILDVSNWKQGMYFAVLFKNGEKKEVKKIVKQ